MIMVQKGPAKTLVKSNTLIPDKAPFPCIITNSFLCARLALLGSHLLNDFTTLPGTGRVWAAQAAGSLRPKPRF
jgi:hypothetical protein